MNHLLTASTLHENNSTRRSQRRRNRTSYGKKVEYSCPNPYRIGSCDDLLPHDLE
jgi:hypothetical protein